MKEQTKARFLKSIVWTCIRFTMAVIVACYVAAWFGVDTDSVLTHTCTVFGGELLLSAVLKLAGDKDEAKGSKDSRDTENPRNIKCVRDTEDPRDIKGARDCRKKEDVSNG